MREVLEASGVPADAARLVSSSLVATNLRGVDSHGVSLLPVYVDQLRSGDMDAGATGKVLSESGFF